MRELLAKAICEKLVIQFIYHDRLRIGQPHKLGHQKGNLILEIYQTGGSSQSSQSAGWRAFDVDEISQLGLTNDYFTIRSDFDGSRDRWESTIAEV